MQQESGVAPKPGHNVAVHTISFRGKAGAIFVVLALTLALFLIGFITTGWSKKDQERKGLWETCSCKPNEHSDWQLAVLVLMCVGLACLIISLLLITLYMCVHTVSKNSTICALTFFCFFSFIVILVGCIVYAVKVSEEEWKVFWSFGVTALSSLCCLIAGILSVHQLRSSGVRL